MEIVTKENIQGAPDLVVEILSESTRRRDERLKQDLYERFGVQEYWLVDVERRTIRVFRRDANRFLLAAELSAEAGDSLASPLLPGLMLPLAAIFA
jgi:Uma2 family endonuclease